MAQAVLCDTSEIDAELARLREELEVVAELSRKEFQRYAHSLESQGESVNQGYLERYRLAKERMETLEKERFERTAKSKIIGRFIRSIRVTSSLITEFDEVLWAAIVDSITVSWDSGLTFRFKNGMEIKI